MEPYDGFKVAVSSTAAARHHGGHELFGMYKANFDMGLRLPIVAGPDQGWERITIPLKKFSSDWSGAAAGRPITASQARVGRCWRPLVPPPRRSCRARGMPAHPVGGPQPS